MQTPLAHSKGMSFVSVVVPAHNEENYLPSCLASIKNQDYAGDYEVIVVDNASTDNTAQIACDWGAKVVYESRRSPACARQKGAEIARGKIIAFIDADTQAPIHWLSAIVWRFLCEPETVVTSGPYAFYDAGKIARIASYGNFISIIIDQLFRKAFNKGSAVWGSNFAVRRSALMEVGGFDTSIRFYGEEYELSLRLKKAGKGVVIPRLFVLTSARRLKRIGVVNQYWNWVVDYFSVLFWYKPISEELEDLPGKAWREVVDSFSLQRAKAILLYGALFFGLLWLNISPVFEAIGRAIYIFDIGVVSTLFAYHGMNPRSRFYGKVWSNGNRNKPRIALTFDDGPNEPYTSNVLSILKQYGIKATFFIIELTGIAFDHIRLEPYQDEHFAGPVIKLLFAGQFMNLEWLGDYLADLHARVQRRVRIFEHHLHTLPHFAQLSIAEFTEVGAIEVHVAAGRLQQPEY